MSLSKGHGVSVKRGLLLLSMLLLLFHIELLRMLLLIPPWLYTMQLLPLLPALLLSLYAEVSSMLPLKASLHRQLGHMHVVVAEVILVAMVIYDEVITIGIVIVTVENVGSLRDGRKKVIAVVTSVAGIFALAY